jgi:hypothetical protein
VIAPARRIAQGTPPPAAACPAAGTAHPACSMLWPGRAAPACVGAVARLRAAHARACGLQEHRQGTRSQAASPQAAASRVRVPAAGRPPATRWRPPPGPAAAGTLRTPRTPAPRPRNRPPAC